MATTAAPLSNPCLLASVHAAPGPAGAGGESWHRYEISQGVNRIVGYCQGGMQSAGTVDRGTGRLHDAGPPLLTS